MYAVCGFSSAEEMIEKGYQLDPKKIKVAIEWLGLNEPEEAIGQERVLKLAGHGGDRKSKAFRANQAGQSRLKFSLLQVFQAPESKSYLPTLIFSSLAAGEQQPQALDEGQTFPLGI
jgi:hypothetical protein